MQKVSIVLPVYSPNGTFLESAIRSVYEQTMSDWHLFVINDGSWEVARSVAKGFDERLTIIESEHYGVSVARNKGVMASSSPFIAFLDADDIWLPDKLSRQLACLEGNDDTAFSVTGVRTIDNEGNFLDAGTPNPAMDPFVSLQPLVDISRFNICMSSVILRRSCLHTSGLFEPLHGYCEDLELLTKLARFYSFCYEPMHLTYYRKHADNASRSYEKTELIGAMVFARFARVAKEFNEPAFLEASINFRKRIQETAGFAAIDAARFDYKQGKCLRAVQHLQFALSQSPRSFLASAAAWAKKQLDAG